MMCFASLLRRAKTFGRDETGTQSIELVIWGPVLLWCLASGFTFFEGFRAQATAEKAAYAVSDMLSRETLEIDPTYITSMAHIYGDLAGLSEAETSLRVTMLRWDQSDDRFYIDWSQRRGELPSLRNQDVGDYAAQLPSMVNNERVILLETASDWEPAFSVGVPGRKIETFVFTRPRYSPQLVWAD